MVNLTDCKTAQEALDKVAQQSGYMDIPAKIIIHKSEVVGIDFIYGEAIHKWKKPRVEK
ncbi:MAG: hypothetical protein WC312_03910 [Candidatus Omnitrophota bacterium]|jgi:hypothetical protein